MNKSYLKDKEYLALKQEYKTIMEDEVEFEKKCSNRKKEIRNRLNEIKWGKKLDRKVGFGYKVLFLLAIPIIALETIITSIFNMFERCFDMIKFVFKLKTQRDLYL